MSTAFQIVTDESADYAIVTELRKKGFSVYSISEQLPSLTDKQVLSIAFENNSLLITEDKDFGELVYRFQLPHKGILLLRMVSSTSQEKAFIVCAALQRYGVELQNKFTVIEDKKIRIRK
jgi:predicted nuclease of predicted toxin-antitoxin system